MTLETEIVSLIPRLRKYARFLTKDLDEADDLVQDCIVKAISKKNQFDQETCLRAWMFTIMHNTYINYTRKNSRNLIIKNVVSKYAISISQPSQLQAIHFREAAEKFMKLPLEQRKPMLLSATTSMTYDDIARSEQLPLGTIRSRMARGRETLRGMVD